MSPSLQASQLPTTRVVPYSSTSENHTPNSKAHTCLLRQLEGHARLSKRPSLCAFRLKHWLCAQLLFHSTIIRETGTPERHNPAHHETILKRYPFTPSYETHIPDRFDSGRPGFLSHKHKHVSIAFAKALVRVRGATGIQPELITACKGQPQAQYLF